VLPGCGTHDIHESAERVRVTVCNTPVSTAGGEIPVTLSVGAAITGTVSSTVAVVRNADIAMYRAKKAGRNKTDVFEMET